MIGNVGTVCVPNGPCLVPVAPHLTAPSGVLMIGVALVLRDLVQRRLGAGVAVAAILVGAALSALVAPPSLVMASAVAFLVSEFADLAVYTPLQRRRFVAAVVASSVVGLVVDSIVFLWLAFGSLDFLGRPGGGQGVDGGARRAGGGLAAPARRPARAGGGLMRFPGDAFGFPETI